MKNSEKVTVSAFSEDYNENSYKFYYDNYKFEFVPKSQVKFLESHKTGPDFGEGIQSRYFEIPLWLANKLKGNDYYSFM